MKKIYFLAVLAFLTTTIFGQSLRILDTNNVDVSGTTVTVSGTVLDDSASYHAHIQNVDSQSVQILICKHIIYENGLERDSFCLDGACYSSDTIPSPVNIADSTIDSTFNATIWISDAGVSEIRYTFWDKNNPSDSVFVIVKYDMTAFGHNLRVLDTNNVDVSGTTVTVNGTVSDGMVYYYAHIQNVGSQNIQTLVCKHVIYEDGLSGNTFCFGSSCYSSDTAANPVNVASGTIDSTFDASIWISDAGVSEIRYTFWDKDNPADSAFVIVKYDIAVAISYLEPDGNFISKPYPVPATDFVSFDYNFNTSKELIIYDITGKVILQTILDPKQNQLKIPVKNLNPGIYYYSMMINNNKRVMDKFVVN